MQTRVDFGEHNPFYSNLAQGYSDDFFNIGEQYREAAMQMMPIQGMESNIQNKSYKIGYGWKPENNSWIDLNANIWRTRTRSTRYQNGATDLYVDYPDSDYDKWIRCSRGEIPWMMAFHNMNCSQMMAKGLIPDKAPQKKTLRRRSKAGRLPCKSRSRTTHPFGTYWCRPQQSLPFGRYFVHDPFCQCAT